MEILLPISIKLAKNGAIYRPQFLAMWNVKVNNLEVPNSHLGDQLEPLLSCK